MGRVRVAIVIQINISVEDSEYNGEHKAKKNYNGYYSSKERPERKPEVTRVNRCYPSDKELSRIKESDSEGDYKTVAHWLKRIWTYAGVYEVGKGYKEFGVYIEDVCKKPPDEFGISHTDMYIVNLCTYDYPDNEKIIDMLKKTMFWQVCWQKSERGGHYYFEVPLDDK